MASPLFWQRAGLQKRTRGELISAAVPRLALFAIISAKVAANSPFRQFAKRWLFQLFPDSLYRLAQACMMAWDIRTRSWYEPEIDVLRYAVRPGEQVLDVGANFGIYTYYLSRLVGANGRVYAFEPIPWTRSVFKVVARLLRIRNAQLVPLGCGDCEETVMFRIPRQPAGAVSAGLAYLARRDSQPSRAEEALEVEARMTPLDSFFPSRGDFSFLKCDVEGAELLVFKGAVKIIESSHPTVLAEVVPRRLEALAGSARELVEFFRARDYSRYVYHAEDQPRLGAIDADADLQREGNYLFIHPSRLERFAVLLQTRDGERPVRDSLK